MQNNTNYLASATISQFDLLTVDTTATSAIAVYVKPAGSSDAILGRANSNVSVGEAVNFTDLTIGQMITCIAGGSISAGDHLAASSGKVVAGTAALVAVEAASSGSKVRVCVVAELNNAPSGVEYAQKIGTSSSHPAVGSGVNPVSVNSDGNVVASSSSVGDASTPVYLNEGTITPCTNISSGASFDVGSDGLIPVGSYGLVAFFSSGSMSWTVNAGDTATVTSVHVARVPQLSTIAGTGSGACFYQQTAGQTDYPTGTTFTALTTIICAANNGNSLALVKRTA